MQLNGKVALVTGGASGLGLATAEELLGAGAQVVLCDLPSSRGEEVARDLGDRARFVVADVTDAALVRQAVEAAVDWGGGLHVAVSCAGVATPGRVLGKDGPLPLEDFSRVIEVNLVGTFNVVRLASEAMSAQEPEDDERGVLVNTASVAAFEGQIGQAAYSASKGGVASMTISVARDLASRKIRCATIAPGVFATPMVSGMPEKIQESLAAQIPHPSRLGRPSEYAALVRHIVENPMLNGCVIRLDGGIRMGPR